MPQSWPRFHWRHSPDTGGLHDNEQDVIGTDRVHGFDDYTDIGPALSLRDVLFFHLRVSEKGGPGRDGQDRRSQDRKGRCFPPPLP